MEVRWARWWLWLWAAVAVALIALFFVMPLKWWAVAALAGFGTMEGIGLIRPDDPYPPLTHVIRRYVPRWAAFTAIYGFAGGAGDSFAAGLTYALAAGRSPDEALRFAAERGALAMTRRGANGTSDEDRRASGGSSGPSASEDPADAEE